MELSQSHVPVAPLKYENILKRLLASLLGSNIVVLMGQRTPFFQSFLDPRYYYDSAISFVVAFAMVQTVYFFTLKLDRTHPWNEKPDSRRKLLILYCILLPLVIDTIGMGSYYYLKGHVNVLTSQLWYTRYIPEACLLLILVNLYYFQKYRKHQQAILEEQVRIKAEAHRIALEEASRKEAEERLKKSLKERAERSAKHIADQLSDAVFYYLRDKKVIAFLSNGEEIITPYNHLKDVKVPEAFMHINQSAIVRRDNIQYAIRSGQFFEVVLKVPEGRQLKVSREPSRIYRQELNLLSDK